jgi:nitrous oxide reductase accessory protein NosL
MRTTLSIVAFTILIAGCRNVAREPAAPPPSTA